MTPRTYRRCTITRGAMGWEWSCTVPGAPGGNGNVDHEQQCRREIDAHWEKYDEPDFLPVSIVPKEEQT